MELFKIMKHQSPVSLYCLFKPNSLYHRNISIILPSPRLEKSKNNFIFKSSSIWNEFIQKILQKCQPKSNGIIILQLTLIYALLYPLQKEGSNLYYLNFKVTATIIIGNLSKISQISNSHPISSLNPSSISLRIKICLSQLL